ncbi:MAG: Smr/MutS family protein [Hyphomicrobiaceae bacterium]|nr:Smr/MutS family protein [Hyphomicrobiaceae bacterium]MCC0007400.1 Smr/MutS family protein [Hyphomicrobiaceae bacterium]
MTVGDGESPPPRRSRHVSVEDQALWEHVARTVPRSRRSKSRVPVLAEGSDIAGCNAADPVSRLESRLRSEIAHSEPSPGTAEYAKSAARGAPPPQPHPTRQRTPPLADFDRKAVRRIRSGRIEIEARIDLHGMRQDEAHGALRAFLHGCQGRGLRWVLVITGKGRVASSAEQAAGEPYYAGHERGILRRAVPRWLAEPDLRPLVVSYTTAALHHGGEGALYIRLRGRRTGHHG